MTALGHGLDAQVAAGLQHHRASLVEQALHQRVDLLLQQRLAAGDLDDVTAIVAHAPDHLVHAHLLPLVERVGGVAPGTAEVAGGQADEHARPPGVGRLPLDRVKDLVDGQHCAVRVSRGNYLSYNFLMAKPTFYTKPT